MCLLVVVSRVDPDAPLVVGANRDERVDRKATAMTVLHDSAPRILGGRDDEAGGTWLAVNQHGVVAGLTNRPSPDGTRDPTKRSRGELPVALAGHRDAASAVEDFVTRFAPADYNPAWILVGDRDSLFALDMTAGGRPTAMTLDPGVWILENNPLGSPSRKVDHVQALLGNIEALWGAALVGRLRSVLADHRVPGASESNTMAAAPEAAAPEAAAPEAAAPEAAAPGERATRESATGASPKARPPETLAACVHTESYGTRSSTIVYVPAGAGGQPRVLVADGHPCTSPFRDASELWSRSRLEGSPEDIYRDQPR
jgi:uncharacterized protein with NRDE domain